MSYKIKLEFAWRLCDDVVRFCVVDSSRILLVCRNSRTDWRSHREMGLMNAIGLQPRHPAPTVTSQGTQTQTLQLQNAETQTDRDLPDNPEQPSTSQVSQVTGGQTSLPSSGEVCHWYEKTNQSLVSFPSLCSDILIAPLCSWLKKYSVSTKHSFIPLDSLANLNKINLTGDSIFNFILHVPQIWQSHDNAVYVYMCTTCILCMQKSSI